MSWDNITGESSILPSSNLGGVQDEVRFESGKGKKLRLILKDGDEPYSYLEHCLEVETFEGGHTTRTFRTIRCPKTHDNPNAPCPLCDGQQVRRRVRHACNVWDYDENKVQKLNTGEAVFKPIATTMKMGIDILSVDWAIMKTGTDRNNTEYTATNLGASDFQLPADAPYYNMKEEYAPHSIEDMKAIVESAGGDWEKLIVPPKLQYPTLQEALNHVMPNGKYKDQRFEDIWEQDKTNRGMIHYLAMRSDRVSPEKAAAQVILVRLGGAQIDGVPTSDDDVNTASQDALSPAPAPTATTDTTTAENKSAPTPAPSNSSDRDAKIAEINKLLSSKDRFVKGGFNLIVETMKKCANGKTNIVDFTDEELDSMLNECKS